MAGLVGPVQTFGQDTFTPTTDQRHALWTLVASKDGRLFRYVQMGAADSVAGSLYQCAAPLANHLANTPPVVNIGDTSFQYTPGATAGAAGLYNEGYLQVDTTPGNGYVYQVKSNDTITASTAFTLTLLDKIQVALTASSRVGLLPNKGKNVIVAPTTLTGQVAGIAPAIITAVSFGWLQTAGICSALINGTPAITAPVINSATTAGALDVWTTAAQATSALVGHMCQVGVSGKNNFVDLMLD